MKRLILALLPMFAWAQEQAYWQQEVAYTMEIDMDVKQHRFAGSQQLEYTNNSPDTIREVFYHLYFNAFQPGSMMDVRSRHIPDPDRRVGDRINGLKEDEIGYHHIKSLNQDGQALQFNISGTVLKAALAQPLLPGESTMLNMSFNSQVPVQIRRSGRNNTEGVDYTMTQWYPKLAAYDKDGWHPDPYVAREFYAEFGTFDVTIHIDADQKLAGTGVLQDFDQHWSMNATGTGLRIMKQNKSKEKKRRWHFKAEQVHDFAWAADEDYIFHQYPGPNGLELNFFFLPDYQNTWEELPPYTKRFFELMNRDFGRYPYPQFSVIQGGDGGMEYPMCTMLKGSGKLPGLVGVMVHEAAHNWYYGVLASNEQQYPWMDEGFTSFAEEEILNTMSEEAEVNAHRGAYDNYFFLVAKDQVEPLSTPADYFSLNRAYGISSYSRGEIFLSQLRYIIGYKAFARTMLRYFEEWKFKHPEPRDFLRIAERESGLQLDWYLNYWFNTLKTIDYSVESVGAAGNDSSHIVLHKLGEMPMPLDITVHLVEGEDLHYTIPLLSMFGAKQNDALRVLAPWPWTNPSYQFKVPVPLEKIRAVIIDPYQFMADVEGENNLLLLEDGKPATMPLPEE